MSKHFYLFLMAFIVVPFVIFSQPTVVWEVSYGGSYTDQSSDVIIAHDGNLLVLSMPYSIDGDVSDSHGGADFWLLKLDNNGQLIWKKTYGGSADDFALKVISAEDNGYFILGTTASNDGDVSSNHGATDLWLLKVNEDGDMIWQKTYGGTSYETGGSITASSDGNFIIAGGSQSTDGDLTSAGNHGFQDLWTLKIDPDGEVLWSKCYGGSGEDYGASIIPDSDGGCIVAGGSSSSNGDAINNHGLVDVFVLKLNSTGVIQWKKMFGNIGRDYNNDMVATGDGGAVLINTSNSPIPSTHGDYEIWGIRINSSGAILWSKCFGGSDIETGYGVSKTNTGNFLFTGISNSTNGNVIGNTNQNGWLFCVDSGGELLWQKPYGSLESDRFDKAIEIAAGEYVIVGSTSAFQYGDLWILHMSSNTTDAQDISAATGQLSVSPCPAYDEIKILAGDNRENAALTISAMDGSIVLKQLVTPNRRIDVSGLPAGIYVVTLAGGDGVCATKFVKQ